MYRLSRWGWTWPSFVKDVLAAQKKIVRILIFHRKCDSTDLLLTGFEIIKLEFLTEYFSLHAIHNDTESQPEEFVYTNPP